MKPVISTAALAAELTSPELRLYDCTTFLNWDAHGKVRIESGRAHYNDPGHIRGAVLLELQQDLSDNASPLRFTMPAPDVLARAFAAKGISESSSVVLYSGGDFWWAARVWWMLRAIGFDRAAILDGGLKKWRAEGRALTSVPSSYPPGKLYARPRPELFVGKDEVRTALGDPRTVILNCLREEFHKGSAASNYGRPGRISGSVNVPAGSLVRSDGTFRPGPELAALFAEKGVVLGKRVIAYCGGGIAASGDAFALTALLSRKDVAVYDASLQEWANDPDAPMDVG